VPVSESFAGRNQGTTVADAMALGARLAARARDDERRFTVTFAVAFGCPFEGPVAAERVLALATEMRAEGVEEIVLADTIGVAVPSDVSALVADVAALGAVTGVHLHNTRNTGYANAVAAVQAGATVLDAAVGGTGGCPFAPNATGNVATEDLAYLLHGMGYTTGLRLDELIATAHWLGEQLGQDVPGLVQRAGDFVPQPL
jgi:hydroxymethylglutaryl-CoA lyase/(R)-citramalyl-CoA lyase